MNQNDLTVTNEYINAWWVKIISNTYVYIAFFMVIYVWLYVMISSNYITILWNFLYLCDPIYQHVWPYNHICTYDHIYIYVYILCIMPPNFLDNIIYGLKQNLCPLFSLCQHWFTHSSSLKPLGNNPFWCDDVPKTKSNWFEYISFGTTWAGVLASMYLSFATLPI